MSTRYIREDVHIHASADAVFERLADLAGYRDWLPASFSDVAAEDGTLTFAIALPGRSQPARLAVTAEERPGYLELATAEADAAVRSLSWSVRPEGREVYLLAEVAYQPASGLFGAMAESTLHGGLRRQALRDALWRLKQRIEAAR